MFLDLRRFRREMVLKIFVKLKSYVSSDINYISKTLWVSFLDLWKMVWHNHVSLDKYNELPFSRFNTF